MHIGKVITLQSQQQTQHWKELGSYFWQERKMLGIVTVSGLIYNVGMLAGPWFDGQLAQCLYDIVQGKQSASDMYRLCLCYLATILCVQGARYIKRLYVRKFANHVSLTMRARLYQNLVQMTKAAIARQDTGSLMTKVIADIDACVEGMRKFTTELFDTGVVMVAYIAMLLYYDWHLTVLVLLFPPLAYLLADRLRRHVARAAAQSKESSGALTDGTLDRLRHAMTYRIYGVEASEDVHYETLLTDYEKKRIRSNLFENALQPLYRSIALCGTVVILYEGGRNVLGSGMASWDIAAFSTYLACFLKLAVKSSHAAKLFNAVQKAQVSWQRIRPQLQESAPLTEPQQSLPADVLTVQDVAFTYPGTEMPVFRNLSFTARPGEIIGITGPVACGKSTLGRAFLCESPHEGIICFGSQELGNGHGSPVGIIGYSGHSPELFSGTIAENIQFGCTDRPDDFRAVWQAVCLDEDDLPDGPATRIGPGGLRLSGGQQARVTLARALFGGCPVLVLDDPFASVDQKTEARILQHLRQSSNGRIILLISHRLTVFPQLDQVIWMQPDGAVRVANHAALYEQCDAYRRLYDLQVPQSPTKSLSPFASLGRASLGKEEDSHA